MRKIKVNEKKHFRYCWICGGHKLYYYCRACRKWRYACHNVCEHFITYDFDYIYLLEKGENKKDYCCRECGRFLYDEAGLTYYCSDECRYR